MSRFDQQVTFLLVADLEASTHFYGDILELEQVMDQGDSLVSASGKINRIQGRS